MTTLPGPEAPRAPAWDAAAIVGALPDAVLVVDDDDVIRFVNPAAEQFFGAGAGLLCDGRLDELAAFDSPIVALVNKVRDGVATITEYDIHLSPGRRARAVDVQATAMPDPAGWVLVTLRERSIAHKLDRQLTHLGAGRSVAGLAAVLAHEIKNPLSGIRGAAQLLEHGADPAGRELTGLIVEESDRICRLVDRMEVFSDMRPVERTAVNIHEVLDYVHRLVENGFARDVRFVERYDPSLPPVFGERDQLVQVFLNLVKNAAESVPAEDGEIVLSTRFEPGLRLSVAGVRGRLRLPLVVSIEDNGGGVPEDLKSHLFEPFVSGRAGGTGLGLALVAKIVGEHGGVVEFDSDSGRTVFRVMLPLHPTGETAP